MSVEDHRMPTPEHQPMDAGDRNRRTWTEGAFTRYPRWFRFLYPVLGKAELRVLIAIIEGTNGWNRKWVRITHRGLAKITGLDRPNAIKGLKVLVEAGVVAECTRTNGKHYALKELGPVEAWVPVATVVAQCTRKWARNAPPRGRTKRPLTAEKPCPVVDMGDPKNSSKHSKENTSRPSGRRVTGDAGEVLREFDHRHREVLHLPYMAALARDQKLLRDPLRVYGPALVLEMVEAFWREIQKAQRGEEKAFTGKARPDVPGFVRAIPNLIRDYEFDHAATQG